MASLPPGDCCTRGIKHEGMISGKLEKIGNIDTYFARPALSSENAIIIISDIFGIYQNSQLIADDFAARGYLTVIPDLFNGDAISVDAFYGNKVDLQKWLPNHLPPNVDPIVEVVIDHLRKTLKIKNVGGVGYCYGGKYVIRHLSDGGLDAGYVAHPSFVTTEELGLITKPLSIAACEIDANFTKELRFDSEKILADLHVPYQINLYGGVKHGFALRGDLSVQEVRFATDQAFEQAVAWFKAFFNTGNE